MIRIRIVASAIGLLGVAWAVSGCAVGGPPTATTNATGIMTTAASPSRPTGSPGTTSTNQGSSNEIPSGLLGLPGITNLGGASGKAALGLLPKGFPVPGGSVGIYGVSSSDATAVVFDVPTSADVTSYLQSALPRAGFPLSPAVSGHTIAFTGSGIAQGYVDIDSANVIGVTIYGSYAPGTGSPSESSSPVVATGTYTITVPNLHETLACTDNTIDVNGSFDDLTITGHCGTVALDGTGDTVVVDSAGSVLLTGTNNKLTYHSGSPDITNNGIGDSASHG